MKEFEFIKKLENHFGGGVSGIGDDGALLGNYIIAKDVMAEGVHFLNSAPIEKVIGKLFTANVSDICAMGGKACSALFAIAAPNGSDFQKIFNSVTYWADYYGIKIIGGDTSESKSQMFLSLTVIGERGDNVVLRSGAKPGDLIYLSRPIGLSKIALEKELNLKNHNIDPFDHYERLAEKEVGQFLGSAKAVTAAIDISDGLGRDLSHIANMSGVKAIIEADKLPIEHLKKYNINPIDYALCSGEEFALLFTVKKELEHDFLKEYKTILSKQPIKIGMIKNGSGCFLYDDTIKDISYKGFEHFIT